MDHLKTSEERKQRWYAKNIEPQLMPVKTISLDYIKKHYEKHNNNNDDVVVGSSLSSSLLLGGEVEAEKLQEETLASTRDDHRQEDESCYVPGIPASLLHDDDDDDDDDGNRHCEEVKKFLNDQMQNYGFVVIRHVLNIQQCNHAIKLAWDYLEAASFTEKEMHAQQTRIKNVDEKKGNTTTKSCMTRERAQHHSRKGTTPASRLDGATASCSSPYYYPKSVEGRIYPFYGAGHSTFQWYIRSQHYVQDVFATIYNVDRNELITSLDGMILWTEYDENNDDDKNNGDESRKIDNDDGNDNIAAHDKGWFHIDQNPQTKPKFESNQGLVNLLPVTENTGGNVLVMGSHKKFPDHYLQQKSKPPPPSPPKKSSESSTSFDDVDIFYYERLKEINGDDWLEIDPTDDILLQKESVIMCLLGAGDMIVWDSRLVHCSYPGKKRKPSTTTTTTTTTAYCAEENNKEEEEEEEEDFSTQEEEERNKLQRQGLTRAAGLVNMIPRVNCPIDIHTQRVQAIQNARTLTHWVDKASPLGEERIKEVELEQQRVQCMRSHWLDEKEEEEKVYSIPKQQKQRVLLSLNDLTAEQRNLI